MHKSIKPGGAAELLVRFEGWTKRVALGDQPLVLGRSADCGLPLPDPKLSRQHCRIWLEGSGWQIEDLLSRTGTYLAGARLEQPVELKPGERVQIGSTFLHLQLEPREGPLLSGDLTRDARNVERLLQILGDLCRTWETEQLLRRIVDRAIEVVGGDRGAMLLAAGDGELEAAVARDASGQDLASEQVLTRTLPDRALQTGRAVVLTDTSSAAGVELPESVEANCLRSVVCVPLKGPGGMLGVLYVDGRGPAQIFREADVAALEVLAAQGALAIERTRLLEERLRREAELRQSLEAENAALKAQLGRVSLIGESRSMRRTLQMVERFAPSEATVCLTGETGTGKEVVARHLHTLSPRAKGPFVVVDCGAIPAELIESELFGHRAGAFTGAVTERKGLFRRAEGGTVLLDEIGELAPRLQTRLLRVLQERTIQPVGSDERVPVDVRIVCATHQDLAQSVKDGKFREDLYYRISLLMVAIPPLRERGEDVLLLARHFLARFAAVHGMTMHGFTREANEALLAYEWPGNVRELEHRVQRAVLLAAPPFVTRRDLGLAGGEDEADEARSRAERGPRTLREARADATERFERAYLDELLQHAEGSLARAAKLAGVSKQLLLRLFRRHGIDRRSFATEA
jgi:transcriptional regulator with GAF, ATPase, and Fis domain